MATKKKDKLSLYRMDVSGKYVYMGKYVTWGKTDKEYRRNQAKKIGFCAAVFGAEMILGMFSDMGMNGNPFLILPYTAAFVLAFVMIINLFKTVRSGTSIKAYEFEETVLRFPKYVLTEGILCGIAAVGYAVSGFVNGWSNPFYVVVQVACCALCFGMKSSFQKDETFWSKKDEK